MELPIKPSSVLLDKVAKFMDAFSIQPEPEPDFIMPMYQLEKILHEHYVSMEPLWVTYEYYDHNDRIQCAHTLANIVSPILPNRAIQLHTLDNQRNTTLVLEQILTVSANAA